jgi:hypothetical protein
MVCAVKAESKYNSQFRPAILAKLLNQITNPDHQKFLCGDLCEISGKCR